MLPIAAGVGVYFLTFLIPPRFTATTVFLPPQQQQSTASAALQSIGMLTGLGGGSLGMKNPIDQYVSLTLSNAIRQHIVNRFELAKIYDEDIPEDARRELLKRTRVIGGKDGLITLEVDDTDPVRAANMANAYVEELAGLLNQLALTDAQQRRTFFQQQLEKSKAALTGAETALKQSGLGAGTLRTSPDAAVAQVGDLKQKVATAEVELQTLLGSRTRNAPEVRQLIDNLAALRAQVSVLDQPNPASDDSGYIARFREFKYQETLYELLSKQFELAKVDEARDAAFVQVVDKASPPARKSSPKRLVAASIAFVTVLLLTLLWMRKVQPRHSTNDLPKEAE